MAETVLIHPNRDKPESKATKAAVILLLLVSAGLVFIVTLGGWSQLQGAQAVSFAYVLVFVLMAFFVGRWNRGVLPVAAAIAILFAVVAAVAAPAWFDRDKAGFDDPTLEPSILGLLTLILIPVQLLLIVFALRGCHQRVVELALSPFRLGLDQRKFVTEAHASVVHRPQNDLEVDRRPLAALPSAQCRSLKAR